jgi:hypothetical protein
MKRRNAIRSNLSTAVVVILLLGTTWGWIQSYGRPRYSEGAALISLKGRLWCEYTSMNGHLAVVAIKTPPSYQVAIISDPNTESWLVLLGLGKPFSGHVRSGPSPADDSIVYILKAGGWHGFLWKSQRWSPQNSNVPSLMAGMPYWALLSAESLVLGWILYRRLRNRRFPPGCCAKCGYDLRATPDRCPECGAVPDDRVQEERRAAEAQSTAI